MFDQVTADNYRGVFDSQCRMMCTSVGRTTDEETKTSFFHPENMHNYRNYRDVIHMRCKITHADIFGQHKAPFTQNASARVDASNN